MLVLTVHIGDEIVVQTPSGNVRLVVGGPNGVRRRLGIDAPTTFRVTRPGDRPPAPKPSRPPASGNMTKGG